MQSANVTSTKIVILMNKTSLDQTKIVKIQKNMMLIGASKILKDFSLAEKMVAAAEVQRTQNKFKAKIQLCKKRRWVRIFNLEVKL